jgi:hypothetical protein
MEHQALPGQGPDRDDSNKVPDDRFLKRAPGLLRLNKDVGPEFTGRRGQVERRKLGRRKKIRNIVEKGYVPRFELK